MFAALNAWLSRRNTRLSQMNRMMEARGVDPAHVMGHDMMGLRTRAAISACLQCRSAALCRRWLAGSEPDLAPRDFCPNAERFGDADRAH